MKSQAKGAQRSQAQQSPKKREENKNSNEIRKVYDNIHGFIYFPQYVWDFIDTLHFQRLRKIKQLSCLEYVFPGATHSRFEHSLGTAHLALTFLNALIENNSGQYQKQDKESARKTITIAGLLHDLGHGPYSHTFDRSIVKTIQKPGDKEQSKWQHQIASVQLFKDLVKNPRLSVHFSKDKKQIERVIALINGQKDGIRDWEFQIISNQINGIDVDKLDYFRRDAFHLGAKNIYIDHQLLFKQAKIIEKQICFPTKYAQTVYNIFYSRYKLYKNYYFNLVAKGIELMICDILHQVSKKINFKKICESIYTNPSQYIKLNDHIIEKIEYIYDNLKQGQQYYDEFRKAYLLIERIKKRQIYKFVREFHYYIRQSTEKEVVKFLKQKTSQQNIKKYFSSKYGINADFISVVINEIGFGKSTLNPLKKVGFFVKQLNKPIKLKPQKIQSLSMLYVDAYLQKSIKIFVKIPDTKFFKQVQEAFEAFFQDLNIECKAKGISPLEEGPIGTPFNPRTDQKDMNGKIEGAKDLSLT